MDAIVSDLSLALRQWRRTPVITLVTLVSLVVGIGASLTLFSLVHALLLATLPVRDPHSLVGIASPRGNLNVSNAVWEHVRDHQPMLESVFGVAVDRVNLARGGEARYVWAALVSGGFFDVLGLQPVLGRPLDARDDTPGAALTAVISAGLWEREFDSARDVLGRTIWIEDRGFEIVGVLPRRFRGLDVGRSTDVVIALAADAAFRGANSRLTQPLFSWIQIFGRLAGTHTLEQASSALAAWQPTLRAEALPAGEASERQLLDPLQLLPAAHGTSALRAQYGQPLLFLFGAVSFVLVIVCANLSALVLARFTDRGRELSVRAALGASRGRLMRSLLLESLLLAGVGAALGLVLAQWAAPVLARYLTSPAFRGLTPQLDVPADVRLTAVAIGLALLSGLAAGLLPAMRASRVQPLEGLTGSARSTSGTGGLARTMRVLVTCQVALSLALVTGAALFVRSFVELTTQDAGLDVDSVLVASVSGNLAGPSTHARMELVDRIATAFAAVPGAERVSATFITPLSGVMMASNLTVPGSRSDAAHGGASTFSRVLPGFFAVMGTPLLAGRDFDDRDGPSGRGVVIVNQAFADRHFGVENPLGRIVIAGTTQMEIVGVVGNARQVSLRESGTVAMAYGPLAQVTNPGGFPSLRFVIRADRPEMLRPAVAPALRQIDPRLTLELTTVARDAAASVNRERLLAWLGGLCAILGAVMAIAGLYGTFAYAVVRRRTEIGVRLALGAQHMDILGLVLREAGLVIAIGLAIGVGATLASSHLVAGLLYGIGATDPTTLALSAAAFVAIAIVASYLPARSAARVDPAITLRDA
jgi:putative ABC transport system permease protein